MGVALVDSLSQAASAVGSAIEQQGLNVKGIYFPTAGSYAGAVVAISPPVQWRTQACVFIHIANASYWPVKLYDAATAGMGGDTFNATGARLLTEGHLNDKIWYPPGPWDGPSFLFVCNYGSGYNTVCGILCSVGFDGFERTTVVGKKGSSDQVRIVTPSTLTPAGNLTGWSIATNEDDTIATRAVLQDNTGKAYAMANANALHIQRTLGTQFNGPGGKYVGTGNSFSVRYL